MPLCCCAQDVGLSDVAVITDTLAVPAAHPWMLEIMHALCTLLELPVSMRALEDNPYVKVCAACDLI
jgi:hypothetical protein